MENILSEKIYPIDDIGFVQYVDHMGDDLSIVNGARVSMNKESLELDSKDEGLISYLAKHGHWTPFSQTAIKLRIKMPIMVSRQYYKHQVGFSRNEVSRRYVTDTPEFFIPEKWRQQAESVKQGSHQDKFVDSPSVDLAYSRTIQVALQAYKVLLDEGVCAEQARMVLPQNMYTEFVETTSLFGYARLCGLRLDGHAQYEIRQFAVAIDEIMKKLYPVGWKALMNKEK